MVWVQSQIKFLLKLLGLDELVELTLVGRPRATLVDCNLAVGPVFALSVPGTPDFFRLKLGIGLFCRKSYLVHVGMREHLAVGLKHDEAIPDKDLSALGNRVKDAVDFLLAYHK